MTSFYKIPHLSMGGNKVGLGALSALTLSFCYPTWGFAAGSWAVGIGHNNPLGASVGGNFTYFFQSAALELGIGRASAGTPSGQDSGSTHLNLAGDIDVKVFAGNTIRPYLEVGLGLGLGAASGAGVSLGTGAPFAGAGVMAMGSQWFGYLGAGCGLSKECRLTWPVVGVGVRL